MLLTADHDDRVVPLHSFKHAAELQHTLAHNPHPLLLRVDTKSGHGAGKSTEKKVSPLFQPPSPVHRADACHPQIEEAVDKYGFVAHSMGLKWVA
jgi:prolyl oligopeptidase